jgi:hypothetical protein
LVFRVQGSGFRKGGAMRREVAWEMRRVLVAEREF